VADDRAIEIDDGWRKAGGTTAAGRGVTWSAARARRKRMMDDDDDDASLERLEIEEDVHAHTHHLRHDDDEEDDDDLAPLIRGRLGPCHSDGLEDHRT
jgi:hypothetical protein